MVQYEIPDSPEHVSEHIPYLLKCETFGDTFHTNRTSEA
jgi:hypothetical protein